MVKSCWQPSGNIDRSCFSLFSPLQPQTNETKITLEETIFLLAWTELTAFDEVNVDTDTGADAVATTDSFDRSLSCSKEVRSSSL